MTVLRAETNRDRQIARFWSLIVFIDMSAIFFVEKLYVFVNEKLDFSKESFVVVVSNKNARVWFYCAASDK